MAMTCQEKMRITEHLQKSQLRRLPAQTLPDATPPLGKINLFSKIAVTFESILGFLYLRLCPPFLLPPSLDPTKKTYSAQCNQIVNSSLINHCYKFLFVLGSKPPLKQPFLTVYSKINWPTKIEMVCTWLASILFKNSPRIFSVLYLGTCVSSRHSQKCVNFLKLMTELKYIYFIFIDNIFSDNFC